MSYRIYEDFKAYVGPDGGAVLVGLYHSNNDGAFIEKDGTKPGTSELEVYAAESVEALRNHLMTKQFEEEVAPVSGIEAETETAGAFDCVVKGRYCEWGGLLQAELDALSEPLVPDEYGELPEGGYGMKGLDEFDLCAVQLELICKMVADGNREFFQRIRRSNAEVNPARMRYDVRSPIRTLEEAKMFDHLFGYGAAVPYLTEEIRRDFDKLADYFGLRKGMEGILFESVNFYRAADMELLLDNLDRIENAGNKRITYPFIPDEVKMALPMEYTAELLRDEVIRYEDIPEEIRGDPFIVSAQGAVSAEAGRDAAGFVEGGEPDPATGREAMPENSECLERLSDFCEEMTGVRLGISPRDASGAGSGREYELSLTVMGRVFYFNCDVSAENMRKRLASEMRDKGNLQSEAVIRYTLLELADSVDMDHGVETRFPEEADFDVEERDKERKKEDLPEFFEDPYDYGLAL